jgi:hypothetical protein
MRGRLQRAYEQLPFEETGADHGLCDYKKTGFVKISNGSPRR